MQAQQQDVVNHPSHYTKGRFEVIDVLDDWSEHFQLSYRLLHVIRYIVRSGEKEHVLSLEKAKFYLTREIAIQKLLMQERLTDEEQRVMGARVKEWEAWYGQAKS